MTSFNEALDLEIDRLVGELLDEAWFQAQVSLFGYGSPAPGTLCSPFDADGTPR